jgi:hypothetical protein
MQKPLIRMLTSPKTYLKSTLAIPTDLLLMPKLQSIIDQISPTTSQISKSN